MSKALATQQVRTVYVPAPASQASSLAFVDPVTAVAAARRAENRALILQDNARRAIAQANDSKVRRFWLGFGVTTGTGLVVGSAAVVIWAWATIGPWALLLIPASFLLGGGTAVVGHRCTTTVSHSH